MNWYYTENGGQAGPVSEGEFQALVQRGTISADTMVWHEGMANWTRYQELPQTAGARPGVSGFADSHVCVECGRTFPASEMISFEGHWVCAADKPRFVQKLKEGILPTNVMNFAGFWIRTGAYIIDTIILYIVELVLVFGAAAASRPNDSTAFLVVTLISFAIRVAYFTFFHGAYGATPGKMALRLKVVRPDGSNLTYLRALGRFFGSILSALILCIGYMMAGWDPEKRALHDQMCDTRVIRL